MALTLLQFDFPANGPWGDEMAAAYAGLAQHLAQTPGLIWKIWTENSETNEAGGIYLFADEASADNYVREHTLRLQSFGITDIRAKKFAVNQSLTEITRGPILTAAS
jgi:hypothetical protein